MDLIISGGVNIYAAEIEQVLVQHPAVEDCAVVGVPHGILGEVPKAFIKPSEIADAGRVLTRDLSIFLAGRLSPIKWPKVIEYVTELPRDPNGKLYKRFLKSGAGATSSAGS